MPYGRATAIFFALGAVPALALPMTGSRLASPSKLDARVLMAKRSHQTSRSHAHRSRGDGGIHPLVGSGNY